MTDGIRSISVRCVSVESLQADLVLAGGGVNGIGHAGVVVKLREAGYEFSRVAGTSVGSIVGTLVIAGMTSSRMEEVLKRLGWQRLHEQSLLDHIPVGPGRVRTLRTRPLRRKLCAGVARQRARRPQRDDNVTTFAGLRFDDWQEEPDDDEAYKLVVMAADIRRGELTRLPWDYRPYRLDSDDQLVVDAIRASMSIPIFFEPVTLQHANGESSTLVDGGVLSNYPIDVFDRTDDHVPRWLTFGVTLLPRLPVSNIQPFLLLGPLQQRGFPCFMESLVTTKVLGDDQGYPAKPWVEARTSEADTRKIGIVEFDVDDVGEDALYENGQAYEALFRAARAEA